MTIVRPPWTAKQFCANEDGAVRNTQLSILSPTAMPRELSGRLVLHADDFGMSRAVTDGILRAFRHGLLTSTSVLANGPDASRALDQWKALIEQHAAGALPSMPARRRLDDCREPLDLGVHLNLTQGRPLGPYPSELLDPSGCFPGVVPLFFRLWRSGDRFHAAIRKELQRQVEFVRDQGLRPTHLNGHQYVELLPAVARWMPEMTARFGIGRVRVAWERSLVRTTLLTGRYAGNWPLACVKRRFAARFRAFADAQAMPHADRFYGTAHAGHIDLALLRRFLRPNRPRHSHPAGPEPLVEIAVHPGEVAGAPSPAESAAAWRDPLAPWRPQELRMLMSDELVEFLASAGWGLGRLALVTRGHKSGSGPPSAGAWPADDPRGS